MCRHVRKKIEEHNHKLKEEVIFCFISLLMVSDNEDCGTDEELKEHLLALTGLEPSSAEGNIKQ